jgi:hypothetical protein
MTRHARFAEDRWPVSVGYGQVRFTSGSCRELLQCRRRCKW